MTSPAPSTPRSLPPNLKLSATTTAELVLFTVHDRIIGSIIGSALGDAIGLYTEFLSAQTSRDSYPTRRFTLSPRGQATPFRIDYHRSPHAPGDWTDDTDHACLLLLSFLHSGGAESAPDPADFAARLSVWVSNGLRALDTLPLGLGRTVGSIVSQKAFTTDPEGTAYAVWVKGGREIAPNGSLMRTHPLGPMCIGKTQAETFDRAAALSVITHVDPRCVVSCAIGTDLIRGLLLGEYVSEADVDAVLDAALAWYPTWAAAHHAKERPGPAREPSPPLDLDEFNRHARAPTLEALQLDDSQKIGYVYKCLGTGILCLRLAMRALADPAASLRTRIGLFERLITDLIMWGGDADTNACFAGAVLGAYLGYGALPTHWTDGLTHGDWLMGKAEGLSRTLGVGAGSYDGKLDKDTAVDGGRGLLTKDQMEERFMRLQGRVAQELEEDRKRRYAEEKRAKGLFGKLPIFNQQK